MFVDILKLALAATALVVQVSAGSQHVFSTEHASVQVSPSAEGIVFTHSDYPDHRMRATHPNLCANDSEQWSGYLDLPNNRHLFFWFFESKNDPSNDPVVLWLNGGPGCTSLTGLSVELGPCRISHDPKSGQLSLIDNPYSWNSNASVIFLDQPIGVGFSHGNSDDHGVWDSDAAAADVYTFLQIWYDVFRKDFGKNVLHIAGESYAGRYIPLIAEYTMLQNKRNTKRPAVPLASVLIGNGITSPSDMFESYYDVACTPKSGYGPVIGNKGCEEMKRTIPKCLELILECEANQDNTHICVEAENYCDNTQYGPYSDTGLSPYDMLKYGDYEQSEWMGEFFNNKAVRWALGVDKEVRKFEECDDAVFRHFLKTGDGSKPSRHQIHDLLDIHHIPVLIYAGDRDFICNWVGNQAWTSKLEWASHEEFAKEELQPWYSYNNNDDKLVHAGLYRSYGNLTFATIAGAGHFAPLNQPESSLTMAREWIHGGPAIFRNKLNNAS